MTRRAVLIALLFLAGNAVLLGIWTARTRQRLEEIGRPDAVVVAAFVEERETDELSTPQGREDLTALVAERELLRGARVLDPSGRVLLTVGDEPGPKLQAVEEAVPGSSLRVMALVDRAPIDATWRLVRRRAVIAACIALVFAPVFGFLLGRLTYRR